MGSGGRENAGRGGLHYPKDSGVHGECGGEPRFTQCHDKGGIRSDGNFESENGGFTP